MREPKANSCIHVQHREWFAGIQDVFDGMCSITPSIMCTVGPVTIAERAGNLICNFFLFFFFAILGIDSHFQYMMLGYHILVIAANNAIERYLVKFTPAVQNGISTLAVVGLSYKGLRSPFV